KSILDKSLIVSLPTLLRNSSFDLLAPRRIPVRTSLGRLMPPKALRTDSSVIKAAPRPTLITLRSISPHLGISSPSSRFLSIFGLNPIVIVLHHIGQVSIY